MIPIEQFKTVVENTPLISIDFIIENSEGKFLLGKRVNAPACGYWFTLGGRILKNETINDAIQRLSNKEFNKTVTKEMLVFCSTFEHFYEESFVDEKISTHYIVLVYKIKIDDKLDLPDAEHSEYCYFSEEELLKNSYVHKFVKDYFKKGI